MRLCVCVCVCVVSCVVCHYNVWLVPRSQGTNTMLRLRAIDALQSTLSASPANWWLMQSIRPLAPLIERMDSMDIVLQQALTRLLLYIATVHNFVPFQELAR